MAKTYKPPFVQGFKSTTIRITDALVDEDLNVDATNAVILYTAGAEGSKISSINVCATGVTAAARLILYVYNGATYAFLKSYTITVVTPSAGVTEAQFVVSFDDFPLEAGFKVYAGLTAITAAIDITTLGGDY